MYNGARHKIGRVVATQKMMMWKYMFWAFWTLNMLFLSVQ